MMNKSILITTLVFLALAFSVNAALNSPLGWDLSNASYDNVNFSVEAQEASPTGLFFSASGNKMYMVGGTLDYVHQYTLSTPWAVSTASYDNVNLSVIGQDGAPSDLFFSASGNKMYITGTSKDYVYQYTLSTPWNLATASYDNVNFSVTGQDVNPMGLFFSASGNKMYIAGGALNHIHQYTLSTPWNLATASYDNVNFSVTGQDSAPSDLFFNASGNKMYITGNNNDEAYQYTLSTPWNLATASYDNASFNVSSQEGSPNDLFFNASGDKMYMVGAKSYVYQYTLQQNNPGSGSSAPTLCSNVGDLRINDFDFNDKLKPGEDIVVEVEVENIGSEDIDDVELELILYDNDNNENASVDSISFDLDEDEELTKEITINVPNRFDEDDDLTLYVFAFEDDNMATNCDSVSDDIKVERDDDDVRVEDLTISPSLISCGENFEAFVKVENFGSDDQDDLKLTMSNSELKLLDTIYFDLDAFDGLDEEVTKLFTFLVPRDAKDGTYTINAAVEYEDGDLAESSSETITLKNCVKEIYETGVSVSVLSSEVIAGRAFSIPVIVMNNEDKDITYEISLSGDWVEFSSGDRLKLRAGQEATMYVSGMVKSGAVGSNSGVVSVKADGTQIKTQPLGVTISSSKGEKGLISPLTSLSLGLGVVVLVVIIVVVFVLYTTGSGNKKVSKPVNKTIKPVKKRK